MSLTEALLPAAGLLLNAAGQVLALRGGLSLLRSVFAGFTCGLAFTAIASGPEGALPGNLLCYCALGYCYFHFINLGETARRVRLLRELYENPDGLTEAELLSRYNSREIVPVRLARLLGSGQILSREGRYCTGKPAVLIMARAVSLLKRVLFGRCAVFHS